MNTVSELSHLAPKRAKKDKFSVGDLVTTRDSKLVYMLVPQSNSLPLRAGSGTLTGICVWSAGGVDRGGDELPEIGYLHNNLGENYLRRFVGHITLKGYPDE